jgi:hypothetical protein
MKRLALALAAASLGTGCYSPLTPGSVDIGWSFVRTKLVAGAPVAVSPSYSCGTRDILNNFLVSDVVVSFDGDGGQSVPCADAAGDGARFDGLTPGSHTVVVIARQSVGGNLVGTFTAQATVSVSSGQVTSLTLPLSGVPGDLDVWGGLFSAGGAPPPFTCTSNVPTGTFTIADSVGNVIAAGNATCAASPVALTSMLGVGFSGPIALDLDTYTIRFQAASTYDSASQVNACSGQAFPHATTNDTGNASWFVKLYDVSNPANACP